LVVILWDKTECEEKGALQVGIIYTQKCRHALAQTHTNTHKHTHTITHTDMHTQNTIFVIVKLVITQF
jgi:hypothetical protein